VAKHSIIFPNNKPNRTHDSLTRS